MSRRLSSLLALGLSCCWAPGGLAEPYGSLPHALPTQRVEEFLPRIIRTHPGEAFAPQAPLVRQSPKQDLYEDDDRIPEARFRNRPVKRAAKRPAPVVRALGPQLSAIRESTGAVRRAVGRPVHAQGAAPAPTHTWSIRKASDRHAIFSRR